MFYNAKGIFNFLAAELFWMENLFWEIIYQHWGSLTIPLAALACCQEINSNMPTCAVYKWNGINKCLVSPSVHSGKV